jgi:hypothetical protein
MPTPISGFPKRGAIPSPRSALAAATPFVVVAAPPTFIIVPKTLSFWGNYSDGDCVTAEEAFAKACNNPEIFISENEVITWATAHGILQGANLVEVLQWMETGGFLQDGSTYDDGKYLSVDFTNSTALQSAISLGPVKLGVAGDQLNTVWWGAGGSSAGGVSGWFATGFNTDSNYDHCVSLCGYGTLAWLAQQLNVQVPSGIDGTKQGYAMFTWDSIGIIDVPSMLAITSEAWLRQPTTVIVVPSQSDWRWCNKCQGLFFAGANLGVCPAGGTHNASGSGDYALNTGGSGQSNWRWCSQCQGLFFAGNNLGVCPLHSHDDVGSGNYVLSTSGSGQANWRWCNKCQNLFFAGNSLGVCAAGGTHNDSGSGNYILPSSGSGQPNWRWCNKCQSLFFAGNNLGNCPAGGAHDDSGSGNYFLSTSGSGQPNWRWCNRCQSLFFAGSNLGVCAAHSHTNVGSGNYVLSTSGSGQANWRWCNKCQGLYFASTSPGVCPAGGTHNDTGSGNYVLSNS